MKRKNTTRNALLMSVISMLLCVSMLVGTTFAWFTDEVTSGMNTIAAGNLDVELLADGNQVTATTKLFDDVTLWEPGVVVYENLKVANVGTLALKYQMSLNFGGENDLDGHKLSEVLKIAVIDKIEAGADRQTVLAAAKASQNVGTLANFYITGELEAGTESTEQAVVIFWEPNSNEIDNLYNANNGKKTSDGEPLHIKFGINLQATQLVHEEDSFGDDYDEGLILPELSDGTILVEKDGIQYFYDENGDYVLYLVTDKYTGDTVNVPEGVDAIGNYAFSYNRNVKTVVLSSTVRSLGRAFDSSTVEKVVLNEGLEKIDSRAFRSTTALKEVVISSTVKVIEDNAFQKSAIKNIVIPATVETIGETAFGASLIETVTFMGNTSIQGFAFRGCTKLNTVTMYGDDVTCIPSTLNGRNSMWFCNGESNNPNTSNITFYVANATVASRIKTAMGAEAGNTPVYIMGAENDTTFVTVKNANELKNALDTAVDGTLISFAADIAGDVTVTQKADIDLIIDGNGKKFTGVMTVFGNGRQTGAETITIKNINFVAADGAGSCIVSPDRSLNNAYSYSHNVTVAGCTFTDPDGTVNCAAIRHEDGGDKNWTVRDCTVDSTMHSILQVNNVEGKLTLDGCHVYSKNGANLNSCTNVEMTGCAFDVMGYAVRFGVNSGGNLGTSKTYIISNSTLKSACDDGDAIIIFRASAVDAVLTLTNTTLDGATKFSGNTSATTINEN